jgi:hypothetical protein
MAVHSTICHRSRLRSSLMYAPALLLALLCITAASVGAKSAPDNATTDVLEVPPVAARTEPAFKFGTPTFFGSGCPADTVTVVPSTDGQAVSVLFSQFAARTSGADVTRDRKSCNLAVPVDVQSVSGVGSTCTCGLVHCVVATDPVI